MTNELFGMLICVQDTECEIRILDSKIQELETNLMPNGIRYDLDKIQSSPSDQMSKIMSTIVDLKKEREKLVDKLAESVISVSMLIDQLDNPMERVVMTYRWVQSMKIEDIAEKMDKSVRWVNYLQASGIKKLEEKIKK